MLPRIGITLNYGIMEGMVRTYLDWPYLDWLKSLDLTPIFIPPTLNELQLQDLLDTLQGIIFTGGRDLDPTLWGEPRQPQTDLLHPARQEFELNLLDHVQRRRMPVLAICLGMQLLNVFRGGSLYQHLPQKEGTVEHTGGIEHGIALVSGNRFSAANTDRIRSFHHQGLAELGSGLEVWARAQDGLIEGIEDSNGTFMVGIQWNPESKKIAVKRIVFFPDMTGSSLRSLVMHGKVDNHLKFLVEAELLRLLDFGIL